MERKNNMKFLEENGINKETIKKIIENNDETLIDNMESEIENIIQNLKYFKEVGIQRIENLIVERLDLFFIPNEKIKENFNKFNKQVLAKFINQDFANIELIDMY